VSQICEEQLALVQSLSTAHAPPARALTQLPASQLFVVQSAFS
jgi:hypothetical protein